jgi:phosphatidylserine/phosphatidylglycerophosphate/cardiolipin synthase-like enzyme
MNSKTFAYANNDVALIQWRYEKKIKDCLGFNIIRENITDKTSAPLPAWVGFEGGQNKNWEKKDTSIWPIQKYNWKDYTAERDKSYKYKIIPMIGTPGELKPVADPSLILETNEISVSEGKGNIKAFFNRGILSTQALSHKLEKSSKGGPSLASLKKQIEIPGNKIREDLTGELKDAVISLVKKAKAEGGKCYLALYELTDKELTDNLVASKEHIELILTNADTSKKVKGKDGKSHTKKIIDGTNKKTRDRLKKENVKMYKRFVPGGHIGHNKFVVYVNQGGVPETVLTGSTNWTANGLCAQSNNTIIIDSKDVASKYMDFWNRLLDDTQNNKSKQGKDLRTSDNKEYIIKINGYDGCCWFSPNTQKSTKPKSKPGVNIDKDPNTPSDMKEIFDLMDSAKKSILFLAFQPGTPSILDKALQIQKKNNSIFIRGAATDANAINNYNTQLFHGDSLKPDLYNVAAASNIKDQFSYWEKELLSAGHAIIHDKIVVIDAFTDNCKVITGSHNLGYKASYTNDENICIIEGDKDLASAYAAHVMDIYEHYRWRYTLSLRGKDNKGNFKAFNGLSTTDAWQDKYFKSEMKKGIVPAEKQRVDLTYWN